MNKGSELLLKALRKTYTKVMRLPPLPKPSCEHDTDVVSQIIYDNLMKDDPCMIARFGANELLCLSTYIGIKENNRDLIDYITGKSKEWWWNRTNFNNMYYVAGFFPKEEKYFERFCEAMLRDIPEVDVLGSWLPLENYFLDMMKNIKLVFREAQNPFFSEQPWTRGLKGKRVLVVHPFAPLIEHQYKTNRKKLFANPNILPEFDLVTLKAVQTAGGNPSEFNDWFEALAYMKEKIDKIDYDICLIGCGAYGFSLAAHIKRKGKKVVHLGGSLQLLFGIRGKRWDDPNYNAKYNYVSLINDYWVRPGDELKPLLVNTVEGGTYW